MRWTIVSQPGGVKDSHPLVELTIYSRNLRFFPYKIFNLDFTTESNIITYNLQYMTLKVNKKEIKIKTATPRQALFF